MINFIQMQRHHRGWLVTYPETWDDWDYRTMREKYFETVAMGSESGFNQARLFVKNLKSELKKEVT